MDDRGLLAASIGEEPAATLFPYMTRVRHRTGAVVCREGVPHDRLRFVVAGSLVVRALAGEGEIELGVVGPGSWVGEVGFADGGPATVTLHCGEPVTCLEIGRDDALRLAERHPRAVAALVRVLARQLAERLRRTTAGVVEQVADGRYRLAEPAAQRGWLVEALRRLVGGTG